MHIAIEGIDGVGKTTIARKLAERLDFQFIEKHLHALFDGERMDRIPNYMRITQEINASKDSTLRAWFYALGNLYLRDHYGNADIITDRYFASNYSWNGNPENEFIFNNLIDLLGKPEITFLIYARPEVREARLRKRNSNDPDLCNATEHFSDRMYRRLDDFLYRFGFKYHMIDTSDMTAEQTLNRICRILALECPECRPHIFPEKYGLFYSQQAYPTVSLNNSETIPSFCCTVSPDEMQTGIGTLSSFPFSQIC